MNTRARCDRCSADFVPGGWAAERAGAVLYSVMTASGARTVPLCSTSCETEWLKDRLVRPQPPEAPNG